MALASADPYLAALGEIRRGAAHLLLAMLVTASVYVVDQVYAVHLGRQFLDAHVLVTLIPLVTLTLGLALGQASLVVLGKRPELSGSALSFTLIASGSLLAVLWLALPSFCAFFELRLPAQVTYAQMSIVCAVIYLVNIWFSFYLLHKGRAGVVFWSNLVGFVVNWLGNHVSIAYLDGDDAFIGLVAASTAALTLALAYKVAVILHSERLRFAPPGPFGVAMRRLFVSELFLSLSFSFFPLAVSGLLKLTGRGDQISMFNVAERVLYLLILPCYTYTSSTVSVLAKDARLERDEVWRRNLPFFLGVCVAFPFAVFVLLNAFSAELWRFATADERLGFLLLTGAFLGNVFVVRNTVLLKVRERPEYCAAVETVSLGLFVSAVLGGSWASLSNPALFAAAAVLLVASRSTFMSDPVVLRLLPVRSS